MNVAYGFLEGSRGGKPETEASYGVTGTVLSFPAQMERQAPCAGGDGLSEQPAQEQPVSSILRQQQHHGRGLVSDSQRAEPWTVGSRKEKGLSVP